MNEQDQELQKLLRKWDAPPPSGSLDARVRMAYLRSKPRQWRRWTSIAAAALIAGFASWLMRPLQPRADAAMYVTKVKASGFVPIRDGKIVVTTTGGKP